MATETFGFARALSVLMAGGVVGRKAWGDEFRLRMEMERDNRPRINRYNVAGQDMDGWEPDRICLEADDWFTVATPETIRAGTEPGYVLDPMHSLTKRVARLEEKSTDIGRHETLIDNLFARVNNPNLRNLIEQPIDIVATVNRLGERLSFLESRFVPKAGEAIEYDARVEEMLRYLREQGLMHNEPVGVNSAACDCRRGDACSDCDDEGINECAETPNGAGGVCVFTVDMPPEVEGEVRVSTPDNGLKRIVLATEIKSVEQDESDPSRTKVILKDKRRLVVRETPGEVAAAWRFGLDQAWWARN